MIYTVTFNPALDYVMLLNKFESGGVNRSKEEFLNPGGKGINVSMMLTAVSYTHLRAHETLMKLITPL